MNIVERILLAQKVKGEAPATAQHVKDLQDMIPPDLDRLDQLFLTAIKGSALETEQAGRKASGPDTQRARRARRPAALGGGMAKGKAENAMFAATAAAAPAAPAEKAAALKDGPQTAVGQGQGHGAQGRGQAVSAGRRVGRPGGIGRRPPRAKLEQMGEARADASRRAEMRQLYRKLEKTQEWAEDNYYHLLIENQNAELVTVDPFWLDYARHGDGPFFSTHLAEVARNFTEMMFALSVLDCRSRPRKSRPPTKARN